MITVTERAKEELKAILIDIGANPDEGLRLLPGPGGRFILGIDTEMSGDQVVGYEGYKVLLVGIEYFRILDGKTVDCQDTRHGIALLVR
jgi:hypothetical protein